MKKVLSFFGALAIIVAGILPVNYMVSATEEDSTNSKIQIIAEDITVDKGDEVFTLLDEVSATDENGEEVEVTVLDDGDFDVTTVGEYTVTYQAIDPLDESEVTKERVVTVAESTNTVEDESSSIDTGSAVSRNDLLRSSTNSVTVSNEADLISELSDIASISGDTKTITITADIALTNVIAVPMAHGKNVVIQSTSDITLTSASGKKHFNISSSGIGTLTFKGLNLKGNISDSLVNTDGSLVASATSSVSGGGISGSTVGKLILDNIVLYQINGTALTAASTNSISISNSTFKSNYAGQGAAIYLNNSNYEITNSTIAHNLTQPGYGYCGSAIYAHDNTSGSLVIKHSRFYKNVTKASNNNASASGGGAISFKQATKSLTVVDSLFDENVLTSVSGNGTTTDGGAIYVFNSSGKIEIDSTTFSANVAHDEGGAISFVGATNTGNVIRNSTFYGNVAMGLQTTSDGSDAGGAMEIKTGSAPSAVYLDSNTFTRNIAKKGNYLVNYESTQYAGGLYSAYNQKTSIRNNIIAGNYVEKKDGTLDDTNKYANVYQPITSTSYYQNLGNNLVDISVIDLFGTNTPSLSTNETSKKAGNPHDGTETSIPTVYIVPNNGSTALGKADTTGATDLTVDERGFTRGTTKDVGSVEIYSITFDANRLDGDANEAEAYWSGTADTITYSADHKYAKYDDTGKTTEMVHATNNGGTIAVPSNPTNPDGYVFVGWNTNKEATAALSSTDLNAILTNVTSEGTILYGIWRSSEVTLTYDANAGGDPTVAGMPSTNPQTYTSGDEVTVSNDLTRDGYKFTGWTTEADGTGNKYNANDNFDITADTTLYAQWEELYNVTFDSQGGSAVASQNNKELGSKVTKPADPTRDGYEFAGWHNEAGCTSTWDFDNHTITGHKTLYAKWTEVKTLYTVTFDSQGGSSVASQTGLASGSKVVEPSNPTREGYNFVGWYTDAECTTEWNFDNDTITGNMTLYAKWNKEDEKKLYTVTFDSQGGSAVDSQTGMNIGDYVTEPKIPTREGYYFVGWYMEAECVTVWNFDKDTISGDTTLYAKWSKEIIVDPTDPKPSVKPEEKPSTQPETGDSTNLTALLALLGLSSLTVLVAISRKKLFKK